MDFYLDSNIRFSPHLKVEIASMTLLQNIDNLNIMKLYSFSYESTTKLTEVE